MNSCKYCGKEIEEKHTFCNCSCAAKYNNAHRIRKPKSKKQSLSIEPVQKCCHDCGKPLGKGERVTCSECNKYKRLQSLPVRMGFSDGTFKERYEAAIDYLKELYLGGESTLTLSKKFNIPVETIWYNLKKEGSIRNLSESGKNAVLLGRIVFGTNPRFRHGWHTSWEGFEGYYRSSYELEYAQQLDEKKIPYRIEYIPAFTMYFDTRKGIRRVAKPDFYLPDTNEIIEIKSQYTYDEQNMKDKFKSYRKRGFVPRLILEGKEIGI